MAYVLRVLGRRQSAEDAFQATFLTLARKGQSIRQRRSLSYWLYRVAYRVSLTTRSRMSRHPEQPLVDEVAVTEEHDAAWQELRSAVDAELHRLPPRYRAVMILCAFEGKTYDEAARELGCPKGTVAIRLLRAGNVKTPTRPPRTAGGRGRIRVAGRDAGRSRRRSGGPRGPTVTAAGAVISGITVSTVVSLAVAELTRSACRDMWYEKIKNLAIVVLAAIGVAGTGASVTAQSRWLGPNPRIRAARPAEASPVRANAYRPQPGDTIWTDQEGKIRWVTRPATVDGDSSKKSP